MSLVMIEAFFLLLTPLMATSPNNEGRVSEATVSARVADLRQQGESETIGERIDRMRARLRGSSVRVSTVRCGGVTCQQDCETNGAETGGGDDARSEPANADNSRVSASVASCSKRDT